MRAIPVNGAAKLRTYRARKRAGLAVLKIPVPEYEVIQFLIETERLSVAEALDRQLVELAVAEVVVDLAKRWRQKV